MSYLLLNDMRLPPPPPIVSTDGGEGLKKTDTPVCPECESRNVTAGKGSFAPLMGCLSGLLLNLPLSLLALIAVDENKVFYECGDCGFKWHTGYLEDAAIKEATEKDQKQGCTFIGLLAAALILYFIFK